MHERGVGEERLAKNEDRDRDQYGGGSDGAAPGQRRCMQIADIEEVEDLRDDEHVDDHRARNFEAAPLNERVEEAAERDRGAQHLHQHDAPEEEGGKEGGAPLAAAAAQPTAPG